MFNNNNIKIRTDMSDMLKLDFDDNFQTVDLSRNNNGTSRVRTMNDNFFGGSSSPPPSFNPRPSRPNLGVMSDKASDLGLDLLINKDKTRQSPNSSSGNMNLNSSPTPRFDNDDDHNSNNRFSSDSFGNSNNNKSFNKPFQSVDFTPGKIDLGNSDDFDVDIAGPTDDLRPVNMLNGDNSFSKSNQESNSNGFFNNDIFGQSSGSTFVQEENVAPPKRSFEDIQKEKGQLLRKLNRLRKKGYFIYRNVDENSDLEDIRTEYENVKEEASLQRSLRRQKDILITTSRVIESAATTELVQEYTGKLELEGWSTHMMETVDEYEDIMEDLHEKYGKMFSDGEYPEARLLFAVVHSAVMFHITKKYIQQMPNLGNLLNTNPNLMREFSKATANFVGQQSPAFANIMADGQAAMGHNSMDDPRDMQGPSNLDDILADLKGNRNMFSRGGGVDLDL